jgi:hypothetical protein
MWMPWFQKFAFKGLNLHRSTQAAAAAAPTAAPKIDIPYPGGALHVETS